MVRFFAALYRLCSRSCLLFVSSERENEARYGSLSFSVPLLLLPPTLLLFSPRKSRPVSESPRKRRSVEYFSDV